MNIQQIMDKERMDHLLVVLPLAQKIIKKKLRNEESAYEGALSFLKYIDRNIIEPSDSYIVKINDVDEDQVETISQMNPEQIQHSYPSSNTKFTFAEMGEKAKSFKNGYEQLQSSIDGTNKFLNLLLSINDYIDNDEDRALEVFGNKNENDNGPNNEPTA